MGFSQGFSELYIPIIARSARPVKRKTSFFVRFYPF